MGSILDILRELQAQQVRFVIVGGMAGVAHGSTMVTEDLDLCAPLDEAQIERIHFAMCRLGARWRMLPERPPIPPHWTAWKGFRNLYLQTDVGQVDILSEIEGLGGYDEVARRSVVMRIAGGEYSVLTLDALIEAKRALGRPKDLQAAAELEAIRERAALSRPDG